MIRRITAGIITVYGLTVAIATAMVVAAYWRNPGQRDLLVTLPPIAIPLVIAGIGLFATVPYATTRRKNGLIIGFCFGAGLYLIFPGIRMLLEHELIQNDGTAFWAYITLPSIYFGIPLPVVGALLGYCAGHLEERKSERTKSQHGRQKTTREASEQ